MAEAMEALEALRRSGKEKKKRLDMQQNKLGDLEHKVEKMHKRLVERARSSDVRHLQIRMNSLA